MKFYRYKTIVASLLVFILFLSHAATAVASSTYGVAKISGNKSSAQNSLNGLKQDAKELGQSAIDLGADVGATLIPFVPAGTTKAVRVAGKAADAGKAAEKAGEAVKLLNTRKNNLLQGVENSKLSNIIQNLYKDHKPGSKIIGDGGAIDALRHEIKTGEKVGGKSHKVKINDNLNGLNNVLRDPNLSPGDKNKATWLLNNIKDAQKGGVE